MNLSREAPQQPVSTEELLQIAAWLDGRLDERRAAHVELLLASDGELLGRVLALREIHTEPVAAAELLNAQALVQERPQRRSRWQLLGTWQWPPQWHPAPVAAGAMLSVLIVAGSSWFGSVASQEMQADELLAFSQLAITQLDFDINESDTAD